MYIITRLPYSAVLLIVPTRWRHRNQFDSA